MIFLSFYTMKTLYLIRHAKSSWKFPELDDFDRPLNKRGKHDAPMMGKRLQQQGILPDLIISSPAKRAKKIAQAIARAVGFTPSAIQYDRTVYEASAEGLLAIVRGTDDQGATLMLVGHNPELTALANRLTTHYIDNVVTSGVVAMAFPTDRWAEVGEDSKGQFLWYDYPKLIKE